MLNQEPEEWPNFCPKYFLCRCLFKGSKIWLKLVQEHSLKTYNGKNKQAPKFQCRRHEFETQVQPLGREDSLEKEMAPHFSILAWEIPWTEKPLRLQTMGSQKSQTQFSN